MGNCFGSNATGSVAPSLEATTVTQVDGPLDNHFQGMQTASIGAVCVLQVVGGKQKVPTVPSAKSFNKEGLLGDASAMIVGIAKIAELNNHTFLASDSFSPCVPVVIFDRNKTWLAHSLGISALDQIKKDISKDADIFIIRKTLHARNSEIANAIFERLNEADFSAEIVDIAISGMIGVVVNGAGKSILVYEH